MPYQPVKPEDILAENESHTEVNGIKIRKGTVAAVLYNTKILSASDASDEDKQAAKKIIAELAPSLIALGLHEEIIWKNSEVQKIIENAAQLF